MFSFIQSQLLFYFAISLVLFLPGYFFLLSVFGRSRFSPIEKITVSFGASIIITDLLMLLLSRFGILFSRLSLVSSLAIFSLICFAIYKYRYKNEAGTKNDFSFNFSKKQSLLIILILFLSIFIKTIYLQDGVLPSSTDLGHHMYWAKSFAESGHIQEYAASDIISKNGTYAMSQPQPISDFIIGEHLIFSAIALISGLDFISYFPVLILFLINIFSLLALFIFSLRLFENHPENKNIAIIALLLIGPIFAIDPPQAKYIAGGVIGNILGNLLVPLTFYFYIRFLRERVTAFLFLALLFSMGLFYTHHLSALLFMLTLGLFILLSFFFNFKETKDLLSTTKKSIFSPAIISFLAFAAIFVLFIHTPSYLKNSAIDTVVGEIKKVEHTGLPFNQFKSIIGEPRVGLSIVGLLFMIVFFRRSSFRFTLLLLLGWTIILGLISLAPSVLKLSIPSGRVANFATYPFSIIGAFALISTFSFLKNGQGRLMRSSQKYYSAFLVIALSYIISGGFAFNSSYLVNNDDSEKVRDTFDASRYLAEKMQPADSLAKDHIYTAADSWVKLYFMRDYNFPVYRANLERYENNVDKKEFCTLWMISNPSSDDSRKCFEELGIDYIMVNKGTDAPQFMRLPNFSQVYSNDNVAIFFRK